MTIRLTSVEAFERVLDKLRRNPLYSTERNAPFITYCVATIKDGIAAGTDEWYLDVDWMPDSATCRVVMTLRYHNRSSIPTDEEFLKTE